MSRVRSPSPAPIFRGHLMIRVKHQRRSCCLCARKCARQRIDARDRACARLLADRPARLYRSNTLRVLCPVICMATRSGIPARTRFRTAVRRKSWTMRPGQPAARQAASHVFLKAPIGRGFWLALRAIRDPRLPRSWKEHPRLDLTGFLLFVVFRNDRPQVRR